VEVVEAIEDYTLEDIESHGEKSIKTPWLSMISKVQNSKVQTQWPLKSDL
jgi:hypothetical protein